MIRKTFRYLNNNNGAAMILAILVIAVMGFLGTALWYYSTTDTLHVSREEKKVQAYYVARSAAETVAEYIIKNSDQATALATVIGNTGTGQLSGNDFSVTVTELANKSLDIQATGKVNGVSDVATLNIARTTVPFDGTFKDAIFATNEINIKGNSYQIKNGNISANNKIKLTDSDTTDNFDPSYKPVYPCNPQRFYPPLPVPEDEVLPKHDPFDIITNSNYEISSNMELGKVELKGNGSITFDARSTNLYVKIDSFLGGDIVILGTNRVYMYVNSFTISGSSSINNTGTTDPSQFILIANDENQNRTICLSSGGTPIFKGVIYAPNSTVSYNGNPTVIGAIIAKDFASSNNSNGSVGNITIEKATLSDDIIPVSAMQYSAYQKVQWR